MANNQLSAEKNKPVIHINMLGSMCLSVGDVCVSDDDGRSQKMWNLLAYLLVHRERSVPQQELIEMLWPDEKSQNPANALKTLLYRVRAMLAPLFGEEARLIISRRSAYSWNNHYQCVIDAEEFAVFCRKASDVFSPIHIRKSLYQQAVSIYKQGFLSKLSNQLWVMPLASRYHSMYVDAVCDYGDLLLRDLQYEEIDNLCAEALHLEPYQERLHALLIQSLLQQGKNTAALNHYDSASELLYRHLGVRPSEELLSLYPLIMREQKDLQMDLGTILGDLRETASRSGAFICEYGFFREAYRIEARRAARQGDCMHIALISVLQPNGEMPELKLLNDAMEQLLHIIRLQLRLGDVVARYSAAQYVLMLPSANYEDGSMIMERIIKVYQQQQRKQRLSVSFKLLPLEDALPVVPWWSKPFISEVKDND